MAEAGDRVEAGVRQPHEVVAGARPPDEREVDRREFLEQTLKACGLGVPILLGVIRIQDLVAGEAGQEGYEPGEHYYGMGVDVGRCIGCGMCAQACKTENDVPLEPHYFNTWIERYVIQTDGEVHRKIRRVEHACALHVLAIVVQPRKRPVVVLQLRHVAV